MFNKIKTKLKNNIKKIIIASTIITSCLCGLFGLSKIYAYELDNERLVGNNTLNNQYTTNNIIIDTYNTLSYSVINNNPTYTLTFNNTNLGTESIAFNVKTSYYNVLQANNLNMGLLIEFDNTLISTLNASIGINAGLMDGNNFVNSYYTKFTSINTSQSGNNILLFTNYNKSYYTATNKYLGFGIYFNNSSLNLSNINGTMKITFFIFEQNSNIKASALNSNTTFVPYSEIEDLETAYLQLVSEYQTVQQEYQTYRENHTYTNSEYQALQGQITSLQNDLSTLQIQYDVYVATHRYNNETFNELYNNYLDMITQRDDLQELYDQLFINYNKIVENNNYGWATYIQNLDITINNTNNYEYTKDELILNNWLKYGYIDLYNLSLENNTNYDNIKIEIYFANNGLDTIPIELFTMSSTSEYFDANITITDDSDPSQSVYFNMTSETLINKEFILNLNPKFNGSIYVVKIEFQSPDSASRVYLNNFYNIGYTDGYNKGSKDYNEVSRKLNQVLETYNNLLEANNQLYAQYQELLERYNQIGQEDNSLYSMIIAVADTPISIFKQIFNFNVLGLDISGFVFSIISLIIIVWLIKKLI